MLFHPPVSGSKVRYLLRRDDLGSDSSASVNGGGKNTCCCGVVAAVVPSLMVLPAYRSRVPRGSFQKANMEDNKASTRG